MEFTDDLRGSYYCTLQKLSKYLDAHPQPAFTANDLTVFDVSISKFDPQDESFLASPEFFFRPMSMETLNNEYSIDEKLLDYGCRQALGFTDIDVEMMGSREKQKAIAHHRAMEIHNYLDSRFVCLARNKGPKSHRRPLSEISQWCKIFDDNSFLGGEKFELYGLLASTSSEMRPGWKYVVLSEWFNPGPRGKEGWYEPHIFMVTIHYGLGDEYEGCLLFGELGCIVQAIYNRLHQPEFQDTSFFPVLLISLFGPRHGRIIQANFDWTSRKLNIRMTRTFSFLQRDESLLDLFMQFYACTPRIEEELKKCSEAG